jgi:ATP-binding cassette subfamily F protein 1
MSERKNGMTDLIHVNKFSISIGKERLFDEAQLTLVGGRRYGLVGPNGCGKTTLMKFIKNKEEEFEKAIAPYIDILLLEQEVVPTDKSVLQTIIESDDLRIRLLEEQKFLESELEKYDNSIDCEKPSSDCEKPSSDCEKPSSDYEKTAQDIEQRLNDIQRELVDIKADSVEHRASRILSGLQFSLEEQQQSTRLFSGGWRMRISLAKALFRRPRLLMLDEPTNHLDLHAVIWLENYLATQYPYTVIVVSHDRNFLSAVCTDILHCFMKKLNHYKGNYDFFEQQYKNFIERYLKDYDEQQKRLKRLQQAGKVTTNLKKTDNRESKKSKEQKKLVMGKEKPASQNDENKAEKLMEPFKEIKMSISFTDAGDLPSPIIRIEDVGFHYEGKHDLFKDVSFGVDLTSRIAIVGPNGTGKSTLLRLMLERLTPTSGTVWVNRKVRIGCFDQHQFLEESADNEKYMEMTPVQYIQSLFGDMRYQEIRNILGKFGLQGAHAEQKISTLSGGQKARVIFVTLGLSRIHLLLLDEPTNHLDLETIDCLITGLKEFSGGIVLISHSEALIEKITNEIWIADGNSITRFDGTFEQYKNQLIKELDVV